MVLRVVVCVGMGLVALASATGQAQGSAAIPAIAGGASAKDASVGGGVVSGHVMFADTNGPARFSKVLLKPTVPQGPENLFAALLGGDAGDGSKGGNKSKLSAEDQAEMKRAQAESVKVFASMAELMISATVAADGSYTFTNVKPGRYYVHAVAPGYIDPLVAFSAAELTSTDTAVKQKIAAVSTVITVTGTDEVKADLRLERGASVTGRVLYDDGTPAAGWVVNVVHPSAAGVTAGPFASMGLDISDLDLSHITEMSTTDDTGRFRIGGLPTGSYVLRARLTAAVLGHSSFNPVAANAGSPFGGGMLAAMWLRLTVYSGNVMRQADATPVDLKTGEERSGYDLTVPLHLMHSVGGMVRAKGDGHPVSGGSVELIAQDANGKEDGAIHLNASIQPDGSFRFDYVPGPDTYTLKAAHAVDASTVSTKQVFGSLIAEQKTSHAYGPASMTVAVADSDLMDVKLDVPDSADSGK
jgi:protocatechuate 3,4-dioxygenase beta subunit